MATPIVDYLKDDSDLTMHDHTEGDLGAILDSRYLNTTSNLSDLENVTTARTNLGLVAGGTGDIWVEKAGDTMTGNLILNDNVSVLLGTGSDGELFHDGSNTYFQNNTGGIIIENDASDGDITFKVNDGGVDTTVMTLDGATGNVGIGTTNPGGKLDVWGASGGTSLAIFRQSGGGGGVAINAVSSYGGMSIGSYWNGYAWVATDTAAVSLNKAPAGDLGFYANSGLTSGNSYTPTIRFNVGTGGVSVYGDTNSSAKGPFYISGTASGLYGVGFNLDSSAQSNGKNYSIMSGAGSSYLPGGFAIYSSTDNAYRFSISSTGNVGIGSIGGSGQSAGSLLSVKGGASVGSSYFLNTAPTNGLIVEGNVGIGTTSPLAKLDVTDGHIRVKSLNLSNAFSQYRNDGPNLLNIDNEGQLDGGIRGYVRINDNLSLSTGKWLQLGAGSLTFYGSGNDSKISHGSQFDGTTWARSFNNYLTNVNFLSSITGTSIFFQSTDANSGTPSFSNRMRFYVDGAGTKGGQLTIGDGSDPVANLDVNIQDASTIGQVIKGATSQAANLQEWRNSSGTGLVVVTNAGNVGIGTTVPTNILSLGGNSARTFWLERHTTANTAGNTLTITAGGATSGATDKAGGALILQGGLSTGSAESGVTIQGCVAGATGTTDRTQTTMIQVLGNKVGFFTATPVVQQTELTDELTTITFTAPGTPDYAVQDLTDTGGFGFATKDEGNSVLAVVANLQTRVNELETKLVAYGLLVDAD